MKRRKITALLLATLFVLSVMTACGNTTPTTPAASSEPAASSAAPAASSEASAEATPEPEPAASKDPVTLKMWESDGPEKTFMEAAAAEYTAMNPHVTFEYEPVGHTDAAQKLSLDGPAGVGADVFAAPHDKLGEMVSQGLILEASNPDEIKANFVEPAIKGVSYDGKLYGYPTGVETYALFYNKALVQTPPQTWDELVDFAKTFNNAADGKYALSWEVGNAYFSYIFLSSFGADLFGPDGTDKSQHMVNSDAAVQGMTYFQNLRKNILDVAQADLTGDFMNAGFQEGNIAMVITGPWSISGYKEAGVDFGVAALPRFPGMENPPASFSGIRGLYVSAFSEHPEEAQRFAEFCITKSMLEQRYEITSQIPPRNDITITDEHNAGILAQAAFAKPMPSIPAMGQYWPAMGSAYANIWNGADVKTELDAAAAAIEAAN